MDSVGRWRLIIYSGGLAPHFFLLCVVGGSRIMGKGDKKGETAPHQQTLL